MSARSDEYPEHLRGDMYHEKPPNPDRNGKDCVTQQLRHSIPLRDGACAAEPLSVLAAELLSDTSLQECNVPEFMSSVWESAQNKASPVVAGRYYLQGMKQLVMLCHELQVAAGTGTF